MSSERSLSESLFGQRFHTFAQFSEEITSSAAIRFGFD
jgi:hypothetical protein